MTRYYKFNDGYTMWDDDDGNFGDIREGRVRRLNGTIAQLGLEAFGTTARRASEKALAEGRCIRGVAYVNPDGFSDGTKHIVRFGDGDFVLVSSDGSVWEAKPNGLSCACFELHIDSGKFIPEESAAGDDPVDAADSGCGFHCPETGAGLVEQLRLAIRGLAELADQLEEAGYDE